MPKSWNVIFTLLFCLNRFKYMSVRFCLCLISFNRLMSGPLFGPSGFGSSSFSSSLKMPPLAIAEPFESIEREYGSFLCLLDMQGCLECRRGWEATERWLRSMARYAWLCEQIDVTARSCCCEKMHSRKTLYFPLWDPSYFNSYFEWLNLLKCWKIRSGK